MIVSIDRIEDAVAVCILDETGGQVLLPCAILPPHAKEGDILDVYVRINEEATTQRRRSIQQKLKSIFEDPNA